jgi:hypothetical protein
LHIKIAGVDSPECQVALPAVFFSRGEYEGVKGQAAAIFTKVAIFFGQYGIPAPNSDKWRLSRIDGTWSQLHFFR